MQSNQKSYQAEERFKRYISERTGNESSKFITRIIENKSINYFNQDVLQLAKDYGFQNDAGKKEELQGLLQRQMGVRK